MSEHKNIYLAITINILNEIINDSCISYKLSSCSFVTLAINIYRKSHLFERHYENDDDSVEKKERTTMDLIQLRWSLIQPGEAIYLFYPSLIFW